MTIPHSMERQDLVVLPRVRSALMVAVKLLVTAVCFWYLSNKISWAPFTGIATTINAAWGMVALGLMMLQLPLVGLRWAEIVSVLAPASKNSSRGPMLAITSIGIFFSQLVPNMFGETFRVWMLANLGVDWRLGLVSVLIDRAVGVIAIVALAFVTFLIPSPLTLLDGHRVETLLILGVILGTWSGGILLARQIGAVLVHHRRTFWLGRFAVITHDVLVRSRARVLVLLLALLVHVLSVIAIWVLARAEGLPLPLEDAAALFTVIAGIAIIPLSIGSWGLREVGVTAMLEFRGVPVEQALFFSVSVGVLFFLASLPGALVWVLYSPNESSRTD
jgi:uncharacterized protein (TIRG00374 family)